MLTFCLWLWHGWRPVYTADHVNAMARMLREHVSTPHRIVCITDMPDGITECETYPLWPDVVNMEGQRRPNCWRRLRLFDPTIGPLIAGGPGARIVSIDIDCVILGDITDLFERDADLVIAEGHFARFNGSMWMLRAGTNEHVWTSFDSEKSPAQARMARNPNRPGARMIGSDQAWLSIQTPNAATWGRADGVMSYARHSVAYRKAREARLWFFAGGIKPWSKQTAMVLPTAYRQYKRFWTGPPLPK